MLLLLLSACVDDPAPSTTPPADTGTCADAWPAPVEGVDGMAFSDATDAWGLSLVNGSSMQAVDLDGDGWTDLVAADNGGIDDYAARPRFHWVLMNRDDGAGGRTFVDETEASGLFARREGEGARPSSQHVFGDFDGDGDLDAVLGVFNDPHTAPATHWTDLSDVALNDGTGHFTLAELSPDLQVDFPVCGLTLNDVDADGALDLFLGLWYANEDIYANNSWLNWLYGANDRLLLGNGDGTFRDVTAAAGMELRDGTTARAQDQVLDGTHARPTMGATSCDLDDDGLPELLAMAYGRQWNLQWHNEGDGTFTEVGAQSGYAGDDNVDYTDNWYYVCWCWSQDLCDAPEDPDFPYTKRQCEQVAPYWNDGWDDQPANLNGNTFSTVCADLDDDGDMDLLNGEIYHQWAGRSSDASGVLENDGTGTFTRLDGADIGLEREGVRDPGSGAWDFGDQKAAVADLDNDGRKDVLLSASPYPQNFLYLHRQWDTMHFVEVQDDLGIDVPLSHGLAIADFDRDGDLDLVTSSLSELLPDSESEHRVYFFENTSAARRWLRVGLRSGQQNGVGIGARVAVTACGRTQVQEVSGGYGQSGMQQDTVLHFGLGSADTVESIEVRWIGGGTETFTGIAVDTQVELHAGGEVVVR